MLEIDLKFKPFPLFFRKKHLKAKLPISWNELTGKQLIGVASWRRGLLTITKGLRIFLKINQNIARQIPIDQALEIIRNLKFLEKPEPVDNFKIKKIHWFEAPAPKLKDVPFLAFKLGYIYYQDYIICLNSTSVDFVTKRNIYLNKFIACFYFKNNLFFNYDKKGFDAAKIGHNARLIGVNNRITREAIAVNYDLILEWLGEAYPYAFHAADEKRKLINSSNQAEALGSLVEDYKIYNNYYAMRPVTEVMKAINDKVKEDYKITGKGYPLSEDPRFN